jgi:hypothetical protein
MREGRKEGRKEAGVELVAGKDYFFDKKKVLFFCEDWTLFAKLAFSAVICGI